MAALKQQVLAQLILAAGEPVSGEALAEQLAVSRSAVWKAVNTLREEGYSISSATNKGYALAAGDYLCAESIRSRLAPQYRQLELVVLGEVDSTNNEAKRLLAAGLTKPALLVAEQQLQGRGRQGRSFHSAPGQGLYLTLLAHPQAELAQATVITAAAAVATCRAIEQLTQLQPQIKWVNDLFLAGKKICGILCEAVSDFESGSLSAVVIGIGVNLRGSFPPELAEIATCLNVDGLTRNLLAAEIANQLLPLLEELASADFISDYRSRSLAIGRPISYCINGRWANATAIDIDERGGLIVRDEQGQLLTLSSGEISLRVRSLAKEV